ncbi:hypothetical protein D5018_15640 [Parashewanella curva]|uniref:IS66 family insertion sequence element accessory protein TnpB n=1 Tax=Parashewanella curva TaxID=2338552 RepID=A0A3L8PWG0_9GAMM|nr:hypothetical protein [Parashewanella curva]RLV58778.1 hypothetical protein D5018_15640 [Parashewanella curva]
MRHQHRSSEEWLQLLEEQQDSGLTIGQFCHQKSIPIQSFHNAKAKIKRLRKEVDHIKAKVPAESISIITATKDDEHDASLVLVHGATQLSIPKSTSAKWL